MLKKLLLALCLCATVQLSAMNMSLGCSGDPIERDGVSWQPVRYEDRDTGRAFYAQMPGSPHAAFSSDNGYGLESTHEKAFYKVQILGKITSKAIMNNLNSFEGVKAWSLKKYPQKNCKAVVAWELKEEGTTLNKGRVYVTDLGAYNVFVQGDHTLTDQFFDSVNVVK